MGWPSIPPVVMLKRKYLRYHHILSDHQVRIQENTDGVRPANRLALAAVAAIYLVRRQSKSTMGRV
jgi:hypothetical protein